MEDNALAIKISESEMHLALDYMSGVDLLKAFRLAYPNNKADDRRARYQAKQILKRPHVVAYMESVQSKGDITDQISETSIKNYIWQTALKNPNTNLGLKAALALGKEYGIGTETLVIKEEKDYDKILEEIHAYHQAIEDGLTPEMPSCLLGDAEVEEVEFTVVDKEDAE